LSRKTVVSIALACVVALAFTAVVLSGCAKEEELPKLVVGTCADYPPFEYYDEATGELMGFDVELMEAIGDKIGMEVEWQDMGFDILLTSLEAGQIDAIIACMTVREDRLQHADFSEPYIISKDAILVKSGTELGSFAGLSDEEVLVNLAHALSGMLIGVQTGTIQEGWVQDNMIDAGLLPEANMSSYERADNAVADLEAGRIDCVFLDEGVAIGFTQTNDVEKAVTVDLEGNPGIAVQKGNTELLDKINTAIVELREEGVTAQLAEEYELPGE